MNHAIRRLIFVMACMLLLAGTLPWLCVWGGNAMFAGSPASARALWTAARVMSLYDRDVILYNIGNSYYAQQNYDAATSAYEAADNIARAKNRCPIRYNWGLALSDKGDQLAPTDTAAARGIYSEALRVIASNECQNDPAHQANFEALYQELLEKLQELEDKKQSQQSQQQQDFNKKAEELLNEAEAEKRQAQGYQNNRRFYEGRGDGNGSGGGSGSSSGTQFVW